MKQKLYNFVSRLTEMDCMLFGHFFAIMVTALPNPASSLSRILRRHKSLLRHCNRVEQQCFNRETDLFNESIADIYTNNRLMMRQILASLKLNELERQKRILIIQEIKNNTAAAIADYLDDDEPFDVSSSIEAISMEDITDCASSAQLFSDFDGLPANDLPENDVNPVDLV